MGPLEVAYILLRFPHLTETFVAEEIREVQRQGVRVHLFSLLPPKPGPVHSVSQALAQGESVSPDCTEDRSYAVRRSSRLVEPYRDQELYRLAAKPGFDTAFSPLNRRFGSQPRNS